MGRMTTHEQAYARVEQIVRRFKNLSAAERRALNENATRQGYILPLFGALDWDIENVNEVSPEERVSKGWVDFAFRLGGIPRFFLETKKASEDLNDPRWVKQAIDYAWRKSVAWALLSDFEGLRVFNAEWQETDPFRAQFVEFSVDTYLSDFERLWWLSRPQVAAGMLDREAEKVGKKARRVPVTQNLFDDLKTWRQELFKHLRAYNRMWGEGDIDQAVLRILNRLIFIRTAEDRQVEPPRLLPLVRELKDARRLNELPRRLALLFREFDAIYNSELFAPHFSENLECEPAPFETLIHGLHERGYTRYNFNAIDADVLGTVYEQYLGHIVAEPPPALTARPRQAAQRRLDADALTVVEKRQKRKSQGIYYTPAFVVKYIVQHTLGRYLDEHGYNPSRPVRVLDMACGSGSFLIEAFDALDRYIAQMRGQLRATHLQGASHVHDHARAVEILTQCLYGVDKDKQAVEVARLNLMLRGLHSRDKLPHLDNLRVGDSLISGPAEELLAAFGKEWKAKQPFNWEQEFPGVFSLTSAFGSSSPDVQRRERRLGGEGGFDVIVGNPPYVRAENMSRDERDYYMDGKHFEAAYGRFDVHILFVERAIKVLKDGGRLGFIIPYSALNQSYAKLLRKLILDSCVIESIVDLSKYRVFQAATVATCIVILRKESALESHIGNEIHLVRQDDYSAGISDTQHLKIKQSLFENTVEHMFRLELAGAAADIGRTLERHSIPLGQICYVITGVVAHDSATGASKDRLIHNRKIGKRAKPYIEAKEAAGRYAPLFPRRYIEYLPEEMHRPKFPELFENPKILIPDIIGAGGLNATIDYRKIYTNHSFNCCVLKKDLVDVERNLGIAERDADLSAQFDLRFILGSINSKLITFYFRTNLGGGLHASPANVRRLPIRRINFDDPAEKAQHDHIVALVTEMLELQKAHAEAERTLDDQRHRLAKRIEEVDRTIDAAVYQLYGLTEEEIRVAEGE